MWVMIAGEGFFSVVENREDPSQVLVRARRRSDLERMIKHLDFEPQILELASADYPVRIFIGKDAWARYLYDQAMEIDYGNFKKTVTVGDIGRERSYHLVWQDLQILEDDNDSLEEEI